MLLNKITSLKRLQSIIVDNARMNISRYYAKKIRRKIVRRKGASVVNRKMIKDIKIYSKKVFGKGSYWPWLAVYSEIRGEFIPGWIPHDYYRHILLKKYNPETIKNISAQKSLDYRLFPNFAVKPLLMKVSGNYYDSEWNLMSMEKGFGELKNYNDEVVIKKDFEMQGRGVSFIHSKDLDIESLKESNNIIFQPFVQQHEVLSSLYPKSLNTIRVFTYLTREGRASVKFAFIRFGRKGSRVDNVSSGGGHCMVSSNGQLGEVYYDKLGIVMGDRHPDTGVCLKDIKIPDFDQLLNACIQSHSRFPYARFIGWDVAVDRQAIPRLIEWNTGQPMLWLNEAIGGPYWDELPE